MINNWRWWLIIWIPLGEIYLGAKWLYIALYIRKTLTWRMIFTMQPIHRLICSKGFFGPLTPLMEWLINKKIKY